uniref:Ground-like domain-containing protein n=1 Tax=Steinernema glaseri TaxID=37863 RepID=A0A1I8AB90_9BILA
MSKPLFALFAISVFVLSADSFIVLRETADCGEFSCRRKRDAPENAPVFSDDKNQLCNSPPLKAILMEAMAKNPNATLAMIEEKVDAQNFVVFCGPKQPYRFLAQMKSFCALSNGDMSCAIFES